MNEVTTNVGTTGADQIVQATLVQSEEIRRLTHALCETSTTLRNAQALRDTLAKDLKEAKEAVDHLPKNATNARINDAKVKWYELEAKHKESVIAVKTAEEERKNARFALDAQELIERYLNSVAGEKYAEMLKPECIDIERFRSSGYKIFERLFSRNAGVETRVKKDGAYILNADGTYQTKFTIKDLTKSEMKEMGATTTWNAFSANCDDIAILLDAYNTTVIRATMEKGPTRTNLEQRAKDYKETTRKIMQKAYDNLWIMCGFTADNVTEGTKCPTINNKHFQFIFTGSVAIREKKNEGVSYKTITSATIRKRLQQLFWADLNGVKIADLAMDKETEKAARELATAEGVNII
jgi:hypothetical protein